MPYRHVATTHSAQGTEISTAMVELLQTGGVLEVVDKSGDPQKVVVPGLNSD